MKRTIKQLAAGCTALLVLAALALPAAAAPEPAAESAAVPAEVVSAAFEGAVQTAPEPGQTVDSETFPQPEQETLLPKEPRGYTTVAETQGIALYGADESAPQENVFAAYLPYIALGVAALALLLAIVALAKTRKPTVAGAAGDYKKFF